MRGTARVGTFILIVLIICCAGAYLAAEARKHAADERLHFTNWKVTIVHHGPDNTNIPVAVTVQRVLKALKSGRATVEGYCLLGPYYGYPSRTTKIIQHLHKSGRETIWLHGPSGTQTLVGTDQIHQHFKVVARVIGNLIKPSDQPAINSAFDKKFAAGANWRFGDSVDQCIYGHLTQIIPPGFGLIQMLNYGYIELEGMVDVYRGSRHLGRYRWYLKRPQDTIFWPPPELWSSCSLTAKYRYLNKLHLPPISKSPGERQPSETVRHSRKKLPQAKGS